MNDKENKKTGRKYFLIALTIGLWLLFAPKVLGGRASYIVVSGNSMLPNYRFGDLVITRELDEYKVGDAVAYFHPLLDGVVFHRIVESSQGRYVLQGDANNWQDSYSPDNEDVLGKEWIYLAGFGKYLESAREPAWLATIVVVFTLMTIWPGEPEAVGDGSGRREHRSERGAFMMNQKRIQEFIYILLALAGISLIGLVVFFARPTTESIEEFSTIKHTGEFSYQADTDVDIYPSGEALTGDPIFRKASRAMTVTFEYHCEGGEMLNGSTGGEYQMFLDIRDESGWEREIELLPVTKFDGKDAVITAKIWFYQIDEYITAFEKAALVSRGAYTVVIRPVITQKSSGNGGAESVFSPEIPFFFTDLEARVMQSQDGEVLSPSQDFIFSDEGSQDSALKLFSLSVPVRIGRWIFAIVFVVCLGGLGYFGWHDFQINRRGQKDVIAYKYGDLIIELQEGPQLEGMSIVHDFQDLVALAERSRQGIFFAESAQPQLYYVHLETGTFGYRIDREDSDEMDGSLEPEE